MSENTPTYQPKNLKQLAAEFGVSRDTMRRMLTTEKIIVPGQRRKTYLFTPKQLQEIYEKLGNP